MRYAVVGAGSVGILLAARLAAAGRDVAAVPRGGSAGSVSFAVITARGREEHQVTTVGWDELTDHDDVVTLLSTKSQDTAVALTAKASANVSGPVVCVQNGVDNERQALRFGPEVFGGLLLCPVTRIAPFTVRNHASPTYGVLDIGRWPDANGVVDPLAAAIAADLQAAGLSSRAVPDITRWKYAKLLQNVLNAVDAACGWRARVGPLADRVVAEARACLEAAGIGRVGPHELRTRSAGYSDYVAVDGVTFAGSSTAQSLANNAGSVEVDYLNGEICLLGRLHGVPTPANALMQQVCTRLAATGASPGELRLDELTARLQAGPGCPEQT
jgi:2-dehydropantoate 2-reductase